MNDLDDLEEIAFLMRLQSGRGTPKKYPNDKVRVRATNDRRNERRKNMRSLIRAKDDERRVIA